METLVVFSKTNKHLLEYCEKHSYDYTITSQPENLYEVVTVAKKNYSKLLVIQDHVYWTGQEPIDIALDGYPFALCAWDLGVIYFDLKHADIDAFLSQMLATGEFWEAWSNVPSRKKYKEVNVPKKKYLRNPPTAYPFKNYNEKNNYNLFNFNGKNTKLLQKEETRLTTKAKLKIGVSAIVLPRIELPFLEEWIQHLRRIGIDKILLYNNGFKSVQTEVEDDLDTQEKEYKWAKKPHANYNLDKSNEQITEGLYEFAKKYQEVEIVEWVYKTNHRYKYPKSQMMMVRDVVKDNSRKWLFIDPDEYINLKKDRTLQNYIKRKKLENQESVWFATKIYQEREVGRSVESIKKWCMEDTASKCMVSSSVNWRSCNIHTLKGNQEPYLADRQDVEIKHFCGNPNMHYDAERLKRYKDAGSPRFNNIDDTPKKKITTFIFNWKGHFENAVKLEKEIKKFSDVVVINSEKKSLPHWVNISKDNYFSGQMHTALNLYSGEMGDFAHIQADCTYDNWEQVFVGAEKALSENEVGIYAPNIDYTPYTSNVVDIKNKNTKGLTYVANTDESVWFIKKEIIESLKYNLDAFEGNKYGYGWDLVACALAWTSKKYVVRDYAHTIKHPKSKGYSNKDAIKEMHQMLDKLPSHLSKCISRMQDEPKKIYDFYIKEKARREFTKKLCVVLVTTRRELDRGDVEKCLDGYFAQETSPYQVDLIISFSQGEVKDYKHLSKYKNYPSVKNVIIKSQKLSDLDDCYIRTPEEARKRSAIPSLGASAGANNLFFDTMIPLMGESYEYYLMIETDSQPVVKNWILSCMSYLKGKKFLIGGSQYKGNADLGEFETWQGHLNGIAFYKSSRKLAWLLEKAKNYIKYQVKEKNEIFLNFDCAIHLYLSTIKGQRYFRNPKIPQNHLVDTPVITNMSLPSDKSITINEVLQKYPQTIILHKK